MHEPETHRPRPWHSDGQMEPLQSCPCQFSSHRQMPLRHTPCPWQSAGQLVVSKSGIWRRPTKVKATGRADKANAVLPLYPRLSRMPVCALAQARLTSAASSSGPWSCGPQSCHAWTQVVASPRRQLRCGDTSTPRGLSCPLRVREPRPCGRRCPGGWPQRCRVDELGRRRCTTTTPSVGLRTPGSPRSRLNQSPLSLRASSSHPWVL